MKKEQIDFYATFKLNNKYYIFLDTYTEHGMEMVGEYGRTNCDEGHSKKMKLWHSLLDRFGCNSKYAFRAYIKNMKIVDNKHESYRLLQQHYTLDYRERVDGTLEYGTMLEIEDKEIYEYKLLYIRIYIAIRKLAPSNKW